MLKLVAGAIVSELKKINQNIAALSVASSIMDRLSYLLSSARPELGVGPGRSVDRLGQQRFYLMSLGISLFWVINTQLFIAFHFGLEHSLKNFSFCNLLFFLLVLILMAKHFRSG